LIWINAGKESVAIFATGVTAIILETPQEPKR